VSAASQRRAVLDVLTVFLRLGVTAFGGPAAHIAMMRDDLVRRRQWLDDARFAELVGAVNLIPGPNSTELAMHLGHERAGWRGLLVAGGCFIVPASVMVGALAWGYVRYGSTPELTDALSGVLPVVVAIIVVSGIPLLRAVTKGWLRRVLLLAAVGVTVVGASQLAVLVGAGMVTLLTRWAPWRSGGTRLSAFAVIVAAVPVRLPELFLTFLRIGSVLYGSGYVLLAFLDDELVDRLGWLTQRELLDAVAVGQVTPGPVFTTATFVGYVAAGWQGALLATVGIFAPSFVFVALLTRWLDRLRSAPLVAAFLDGVVVASFALLVVVSWRLGGQAIADIPTALIGAVAALVLWRTKLNSAWLIAAGAVAGVIAL
jgi:chromate transporter